MKLRHITKIYHNQSGDVTALHDINLDLNKNGIIAIFGPSGSGKSTLLNIIAGNDKDYQGSVEEVPHFDYLTQEFELFEEMSVYDNLYLVLRNRKKILTLLEEYEMLEHKDAKVKYLSNGEKKRVQLIRCLLHKPGMILCDEPTSALDQENVDKVMQTLKKMSDTVQILLVTHDETITEKYSDRKIMLKDGCVMSDTVVHEKELCAAGTKIKKRSWKNTFEIVLKEFTSRISSSFSQILLFSLCICSLFITVNMKKNIVEQSEYHTVFENGTNFVVSLPKEVSLNDGEGYSGYNLKYSGLNENDLFSYEEVKKIIDEIPEVIGVEYFNSYQYQDDIELDTALNQTPSFYTFEYNGLIQQNTPGETPFLLKSDFTMPEEEFDKTMILESYPKSLVQVFDIVNQYDELPLLCGKYPTGEEALISKDTADLLMQMNGYSSYEELIGTSMKLGLLSYQNWYHVYEKDIEPFDMMDIQISGITSVSNSAMRMIFFNSGFGNNPIFKHYVSNKETLKMEYVRFMLKPGSDYAKIAETMQSYFNKEHVDMVQYQGKGLGKEHSFYQSYGSVVIYGLLISALCLFTLCLEIFLHRKTLKKEGRILKKYGYSISAESILRNGLYAFFSFILVWIINIPLSNFINTFARLHYYQSFMTMDVLWIFVLTLIIMGWNVIIEIFLRKRDSYD